MLSVQPVRVKKAIILIYCSFGIVLLKALLSSAFAQAPSKFVFFVVLIVMYAFLIYLLTNVAKGKSWARTFYTILFIVGLPSSLPVYYQEYKNNFLLGSLNFVAIGMQLIALYLLFTGESKAWFAKEAQSQTNET